MADVCLQLTLDQDPACRVFLPGQSVDGSVQAVVEHLTQPIVIPSIRVVLVGEESVYLHHRTDGLPPLRRREFLRVETVAAAGDLRMDHAGIFSFMFSLPIPTSVSASKLLSSGKIECSPNGQDYVEVRYTVSAFVPRAGIFRPEVTSLPVEIPVLALQPEKEMAPMLVTSRLVSKHNVYRLYGGYLDCSCFLSRSCALAGQNISGVLGLDSGLDVDVRSIRIDLVRHFTVREAPASEVAAAASGAVRGSSLRHLSVVLASVDLGHLEPQDSIDLPFSLTVPSGTQCAVYPLGCSRVVGVRGPHAVPTLGEDSQGAHSLLRLFSMVDLLEVRICPNAWYVSNIHLRLPMLLMDERTFAAYASESPTLRALGTLLVEPGARVTRPPLLFGPAWIYDRILTGLSLVCPGYAESLPEGWEKVRRCKDRPEILANLATASVAAFNPFDLVGKMPGHGSLYIAVDKNFGDMVVSEVALTTAEDFRSLLQQQPQAAESNGEDGGWVLVRDTVRGKRGGVVYQASDGRRKGPVDVFLCYRRSRSTHGVQDIAVFQSGTVASGYRLLDLFLDGVRIPEWNPPDWCMKIAVSF